MDMSGGFKTMSNCSLRTRSSWFWAFCWTTLFMSCFIGLLPLIGWEVGHKYHEFRDVLVALMQTSFVGSVYLLILLSIKWRRGDWMIPLHGFMGVFACGAAITAGAWLGIFLFEQRVLHIAFAAPLCAWVLVGVKRFVDFATVPNRR